MRISCRISFNCLIIAVTFCGNKYLLASINLVINCL